MLKSILGADTNGFAEDLPNGGGGVASGSSGGSGSGSTTSTGAHSQASCGLRSSSISSGLSAVCDLVSSGSVSASASGGSTPATVYCPACVANSSSQHQQLAFAAGAEALLTRDSKSGKRPKARKSTSSVGCLDAQHIRNNLRKSTSSSMRSTRGPGAPTAGNGSSSSSSTASAVIPCAASSSRCNILAYDGSINGSCTSVNGKANSPGSYSCNALNVDFSSYTATHQWTRMLECAEFVGAK